jgi:predicted nucleic acid-binding protein
VTLVVDASVASKWFLPAEAHTDRALAIVRSATPLIAPDILVAEVCNVAWRAARLGRIPQAQLSDIAKLVPGFFDSLVGAAALASRAVEIAGELDHPVYDCLYVALAETRELSLVTADMRLLGRLRGSRWAECALDLAGYG